MKAEVVTKAMSVKQYNRKKIYTSVYGYIVKILKKIDRAFENSEKLKGKLEFMIVLVHVEW